MPIPSTASIVAAPLVGVALVALTGCGSVLSSFGSHEQEQVYATASAVDEPRFTLPHWVPEAAADVRIRVETDGPGALLRFASASLHGCDTGRLDDAPPMDSSWFPLDPPAEGWLCGDWRVFERDGVVYGWTG